MVKPLKVGLQLIISFVTIEGPSLFAGFKITGLRWYTSHLTWVPQERTNFSKLRNIPGKLPSNDALLSMLFSAFVVYEHFSRCLKMTIILYYNQTVKPLSLLIPVKIMCWFLPKKTRSPWLHDMSICLSTYTWFSMVTGKRRRIYHTFIRRCGLW